TSPDTTHRPAGPSGGTLLADRREQCCDVGPAAAATRRSTRVLGDLLDGRKRTVTDRVDDLAACDALARADVEVRIELGGRRLLDAVEQRGRDRVAVSQQLAQGPCVAQVAEKDRTGEASVIADEQAPVAPPPRVERQHLLVALVRGDAPAAEQLDPGDLQRRRGR